MLKRLYVDNFKALVNFELQLDGLGLLLGPNGSGKSTAFEVIRLLRDFISGEKTAGDLFYTSSLTKWQRNDVQAFELSLSGNGGLYTYRLEIDHERAREVCRVGS